MFNMFRRLLEALSENDQSFSIATKKVLYCNKKGTVLQQKRYCIATKKVLHCNKKGTALQQKRYFATK
jgi:DNA polymerase III alpha subunit